MKDQWKRYRVQFSDEGDDPQAQRVTRVTFDGGSIAGVDADAGEFDVVGIRAVRANGWTLTEEALRASVDAGLWNNAAVFLNHVPLSADGGSRPLQNLAGVLTRVRFQDGAVVGRVSFRGPAAAQGRQLASQMVAARDGGPAMPRVGLSADLELLAGRDRVVQSVARVHSLDVVFDPAAGGEFLRQAREQFEARNVSEGDDNHGGLMQDELRLLLSERMRDGVLAGSGLDQSVRDRLRSQYAGMVVSRAEFSRTVRSLEDLVRGSAVRLPGARLDSVSDGFDRMTFSLYRLLGLDVPDSESSGPRLTGIREWYLRSTGDYEFRGAVQAEHAQFANVTTAVMANVCADAINKLMLGAFNMREKWWEPICSHRDLDNMQTMNMIQLYGYSTLATVAEGGTYAELTWDDYKETASPVKKGNYVGITLEMMANDDTEAFRQIPMLLGSAAWNTVSDLVSAVFTASAGVGPTLADGDALFHTNHANLLTTAFGADHTALDAVATAMMKQTELGSGRRLGVLNAPRYVVVPIDLRTAALVVRNTKYKAGGSNNDVNPYFESYEVIVAPQWTDATDWAAVADPALSPGIIVGYWAGHREPEIFVADDSVVGSMFTNDEMRIKARWIVCVGVGNYRGLHKSNVA